MQLDMYASNTGRRLSRALAGWVAICAGIWMTGSISAASISAPAPDFSLPSAQGDTVTLADLRGRVVMLNFWASWCGPCRQEMPHLEALHQRYEGLGFTLLGVNVEDDPGSAQQWLADNGEVSFPILFDSGNRVSKLYDVIAMPSTVIVDRTGDVRFIHHGYKPGYENEYQTHIRTLLRE
jgi:peroxiredoxin